MTWLISDEARKHRAFREVWVAYLLGGLYLLLGLYTEISEQNYSALYDAQQKWLFVQQNIYSYGATLTAFLLAVGLPRLVCCEREYRTDDLVGTAALGRRCTIFRRLYPDRRHADAADGPQSVPLRRKLSAVFRVFRCRASAAGVPSRAD